PPTTHPNTIPPTLVPNATLDRYRKTLTFVRQARGPPHRKTVTCVGWASCPPLKDLLKILIPILKLLT
ncbi:hypothetical protein ACE1CI_08470, partial [Aerosakkonemataceae cyanobacterium BLCC-F50]